MKTPNHDMKFFPVTNTIEAKNKSFKSLDKNSAVHCG